ncbi:MAG: iron-sulfur cluster repair di-iron protein [Candidatus Krumholzibacteria bacterium]|nr:iron-sulfur cluster repair di-iron protein [Candidatus Krumholzibacteria bacterium]
MADLNPDRTLGDLVAENPALAGAFEALGLDFCCGGAQPLAAACREAGLDVATVARLIEHLPAPTPGGPAAAEPDLCAMSLTELVDHIEATHHAYMHEILPRLGKLAAQVSAAHGANHPGVRDMEEVLAGLNAEITQHLGKEEQVLFPAIRVLEQNNGNAAFHCGHLSNPIRVMEFEHDQAGAALKRLRSLSGGYTLPADACETFRAYYAGLQDLERDLHRHIHKENNVLFPRALVLCGAADAERIGSRAG